jgi:hypothetical protein
MISEQTKRNWKSVVTVYTADRTAACETHARSSGSPQYEAAVLPTVDQNQKKSEKMHYNRGLYEKTTCHENSKQFFVKCFSNYIKYENNIFCHHFIYTN